MVHTRIGNFETWATLGGHAQHGCHAGSGSSNAGEDGGAGTECGADEQAGSPAGVVRVVAEVRESTVLDPSRRYLAVWRSWR